MRPLPMRPAQNALVVLATFLVAGGLFPWSPRLRLACAAGAIAIVVVLCVARLRGHAAVERNDASDDVAARVERIRSARASRMGPRR